MVDVCVKNAVGITVLENVRSVLSAGIQNVMACVFADFVVKWNVELKNASRLVANAD